MSTSDTNLDELVERVSGIRGARDRADVVLRDMIRKDTTAVFLGLNGRLQNEARDLQAFIDLIYSRCDGQSRTNIQGFKREIEEILQERQTAAAGGLSNPETEVDTPDLHINRITDLTRRIDQLCPLVIHLDRIWQRLNELYENIRLAEEGR